MSEDNGEASAGRSELITNEQGKPVRVLLFDAEGNPTQTTEYFYRRDGRESGRLMRTPAGEQLCLQLFYYDEQGRRIRMEEKDEHGIYYTYLYSYDEENGKVNRKTLNADGAVIEESVIETWEI